MQLSIRPSTPNFTVGLQAIHKRDARDTLISVMLMTPRNCTRPDVGGEPDDPQKGI